MILFSHAAGEMFSFNRIERRSLATATGLVVLGSVIRLGFGPSLADTAWRPAGGDGIEAISVNELLSSVEQGVADETRARTPLAAGETVDPNFADASELRRLPGIGPARAAAIVRDRREKGPYRFLEELERVDGLGPTTIARLSPFLSLVPRPSSVQTAGARLDLNRAGPDELIELPGIGPELAERIVGFRARNGRLREVNDLLEVPGIGPATVEKIRNRVRIQ
jgi:competence protein ComEA